MATKASSMACAKAMTTARPASTMVTGTPETCGATACTASTKRARATSSRRSAAGTISSRSEEHTSELQSLMRISYAVFCLKKKIRKEKTPYNQKPPHINKTKHYYTRK